MAETTANRDIQKKTVRTTVSLPQEDYVELERLAKQKKVSVAWVIREAVERYLNQQPPISRK
jgi:predicted DNA-binding protein